MLADALALADEEAPQQLMTFATLTGAARVALGPDLPAFFTDDAAWAADLRPAEAIGDPVWRLPLWPGYERHLDSEVADMNNVYDAPVRGRGHGGPVPAPFRKERQALRPFRHLRLAPRARPLGPKGGEPQAARAVFEMLAREYAR